MTELKKVNEFVQSSKVTVDSTYRHEFHLMPEVGWLNDSNGFVYFRGEYHLFYQYHPYSSEWGPMHWGHAKSKDLLTWEELPVALVPVKDYEMDGCFSGSAIVKDNKLYLMYTGHYDRDGKRREVQCLAVSEDGVHFEKLAQNPVIAEQELQNYGDITEFRDPKVFEREGKYYTVIATKTFDDRGRILMFESTNLIDWEFYSVVLEGKSDQGIMWECPDLFQIDGKDCLIMSPIEMEADAHAYHNMSSTVAFIGEMNWETGQLNVENYHEIDTGLDFYAPQTCENNAGERVMIAWMQMWKRNIPTHDLGHGWAGAMTLARTLRIENNELVQQPFPSLYEHLDSIMTQEDLIVLQENDYVVKQALKKQSYLKLTVSTFDSFEIKLLDINDHYLSFTYDGSTSCLSFSRERVGYPIMGVEKTHLASRSLPITGVAEELTLEFIRDNSSLEVFINQKETMTFNFYETAMHSDMSLRSFGKLKIKEIVLAEVK